MNILVVDDQTGILRSINKLLSRLGYSCYLYVNPQHALEAYATEKFDAVLCDYKMPGMFGDVFLERVLTKNPQAAVIIMSGCANEAQARELLRRGLRLSGKAPGHRRDAAAMRELQRRGETKAQNE
jgi:DNA-binding NtrC family response regulator